MNARHRHSRRRGWPFAGGLLAAIAAVSIVVASQELGEGTGAALSPQRVATHSTPSAPLHSGPVDPSSRTGKKAQVVRPHDVYGGDRRGDFSPAVAGIKPRVYVPNTLDGTIDEIDPSTFRVIKRITVGGQPHHVTPAWGLHRLYVDNPGSGLLQLIDPKTGSLVRSIDVASPYNLYFTPDGRVAIVVAEYDSLIEFRDPHTWALIKQVRIPWAGVDHLDFSADGRFLLVSCEYSGIVVRLNTAKMAITGTIDVGGLPIDVKISPDGRVFYVANQGLGGVSVIDPVRMRPIGFIPTGVGAHGMAVSRNGKLLYVSNRRGGSISVISFRTRRVVATWPVGGSPDMLQVSPDGRQLWTSNRYGDTVSAISTRTGRVIHTIVVGQGPHGLTFFPQPGRHSIGHNGVYR